MRAGVACVLARSAGCARKAVRCARLPFCQGPDSECGHSICRFRTRKKALRACAPSLVWGTKQHSQLSLSCKNSIEDPPQGMHKADAPARTRTAVWSPPGFGPRVSVKPPQVCGGRVRGWGDIGRACRSVCTGQACGDTGQVWRDTGGAGLADRYRAGVQTE